MLYNPLHPSVIKKREIISTCSSSNLFYIVQTVALHGEDKDHFFEWLCQVCALKRDKLLQTGFKTSVDLCITTETAELQRAVFIALK